MKKEKIVSNLRNVFPSMTYAIMGGLGIIIYSVIFNFLTDYHLELIYSIGIFLIGLVLTMFDSSEKENSLQSITGFMLIISPIFHRIILLFF